MAEVAEWKTLDSKELNPPSLEDVKGVVIKSYVSPYDVPEAIRVHKRPDDCHFRIEFRYIGGDEPLKEWLEDEHVKLWLGRDSRRLCRVEFDLQEDKPEAVNRVIDKLAGEVQRPPRQGNYQLTKKVLKSLFDSWDYPECKAVTNPTG